MDLRRYEGIKFALAEILRAVAVHEARSGKRETASVRDLFARLASDRFNLAVVGRFSRGKSTLMNAILGMDRLPTGVVPLTSVVTSVAYGSEEKAVLHFGHTGLFSDVPLRDLAQHVTEQGNPGNARRIREAEVQLPAEILRRGFHFVDTPGLGSSIVENTRTTAAFLPEADALVLVTGFDSPLSAEEAALLDQEAQAGRRVFVAVNKQDAVADAERREALAYLAARLPPGAALFPVSARQALAAKLAGDAALLASSGVPALEAVLVRFLLEERRRAFLSGMCDRVAAVLHGPQAPELADRLGALRAKIEALGEESAAEAPERPVPRLGVPQGCEACAAVAQTVFDFFAHLQLRMYGDAAVQAELAERSGLCGPHLARLEAFGAARDIAIGLAPVLDCQAARLEAVARSAPAPALACDLVEDALASPQSCPACEAAQQAEDGVLSALAHRVHLSPAATRDGSLTPCLPHLARLTALMPDAGRARDLLLEGAARLTKLAEDARRFTLKQDAGQRFAVSQEETAAARTTLRLLAGEPDGCAPRAGRLTSAGGAGMVGPMGMEPPEAAREG